MFISLPAMAATEALDRLEKTIADCVKRKDNPKYAVFHGCWDWHSAAHAHWALFRIARVRGTDSDATKWAEASLAPARLAQEVRRLTKQVDFENPYGRAWALRLVVDFEAWAKTRGTKNPQRLRGLGDLVAESLLAKYRASPPSPDDSEYDNASWAMTQLHLYFAHTGDMKRLSEVVQLINENFMGADSTLSFELDGKEFFSRYGNWAYLIARTQSSQTLGDFLVAHPVSEELKPREAIDGIAHSLAINWSRIWAMAALRARIDDADLRARLDGAIATHVAKGLEIHEKYKGDYRKYGHWVAQFAVYALTEGIVQD